MAAGACVLVCAVAAETWVLHGQIARGFEMLFSDGYDGVIETAIFEHWSRVLRGLEPWNRTSWFAPFPDTLGYNDGFLLFGLLHALFRALGMGLFLAREFAVAGMRVAGFLFFVWLARRAAGLTLSASLLGAALFTIWNSLGLHDNHAQLMTVALAPLGLGLLVQAVEAERAGRTGALLVRSAGFCVTLGLWLLTGFYMAWFFILFTGLVLLAWPRAWRAARAAPLLLVMLAASLAPFLAVYLPAMHQTGGHDYAEVTLLPIRALLHVGPGNLLDGWLDRLVDGDLPSFGELTVGITPLVLLAAAAGALCRTEEAAPFPWRPMTVATLILALLPLDLVIGPHRDLSPWQLVYRFVPGAAGLRSVSRMALFLAFPLSLLAARAIAHLQRRRRLASALVACALLAEQINLQMPLSLARGVERARVAAPPAPAACRRFFVVSAPPAATLGPNSRTIYDLYAGNVSAMLLSELAGIPTINGFSTFNPPDWNFEATYGPGYPTRVALYAHAHDVEDGLCEFDLRTHRWSRTDPTLAPFAAVAARPGEPPPRLAVGQGWSSDEDGNRWTLGHDAIFDVLLGASAPAIRLVLHGVPFVAGGRTSPLVLFANGTPVARWQPGPGEQDLAAVIPARLTQRGVLRLRLHVVHPASPASLGGGSDDARELGLFVQRIEVTPRP